MRASPASLDLQETGRHGFDWRPTLIFIGGSSLALWAAIIFAAVEIYHG